MLRKQVSRTLMGFTLRLAQTFAQLSPEAQRAIWACRIIKEIGSAKEEIDYFEVVDGKRTIKPSLADKIKGLTLKSVEWGQDQLDDEIREDVLKMFTTGIILNYNVFSQERILDAVKPFATQGQNLNFPFIFYPNILVTKYMFNKIIFQTAWEELFLLYGDYGISKTVSIILLHQLSSIVNQYFYIAHSSKEQMKELNSLIERKLIKAIPKIFYYSSNTTITNYTFTKIIKQQCSEPIRIKQDSEKLQEIISSDQFAKIQRLYLNRGIKVVVVFDQLNEVASILKKYNTELQERKLTVNQFLLLKNQLNLAQGQIYRIARFKKLGHIFFNNAGYIGSQLFRKQADPSPHCQYTFDFNRNDKMSYEKLPYDKFLLQPWGQVSFSHCVWSQISRKLIFLSISAETIDRMKEIYFQKLYDTQHRWPSYMRFLNVRQAVFPEISNCDKKSPFNGVDQQNYFGKLEQGINSMLEIGYRTLLKELTLFLWEGTIQNKTKKIKMVNIIHKYASNASEESYQNLKPLQISLKNFEDQLGVSLKKFELQQKIEIKLFPFFTKKIQKVQYVMFSYTPCELKKIFSHLILIFIKNNLSSFQYSKQYLLWNSKALGLWVQFCCLKLLMKFSAQISMSVETPYQRFPTQITVFQVKKFLHFNIKYRKIWNNFSPLLRAASENNDRYFIGVPAATLSDKVIDDSDFQTMSLSYNSQCIDMAIVKCVNNVFYIDTLDFTIENTVSQIRSRVQKAAKLLQQITNQNTGNNKEIDNKKETNEQITNTAIRYNLLAEQIYPTFEPVKQRKNFVVRHIIVLPKQILNQVKVAQIKDQLALKQNNQAFNYEEEYNRAKKDIATLLNIGIDKVVMTKKTATTQTLIYKSQKWSIYYASLEDIKSENEIVKQEAHNLKNALNVMHFRK